MSFSWEYYSITPYFGTRATFANIFDRISKAIH